jgi:hypothetical protein
VGLVVHAEVVGDAVDVLWHAAALLLDVPIREHISEAWRDPERSVLGQHLDQYAGVSCDVDNVGVRSPRSWRCTMAF